MFNNLLSFWRGKDFLNKVLEDFEEMLSDSQDMFDSVCKKLIYNQEIEGLRGRIYSVDRKVNKLQKDIRKSIVQHLTIRPSVDVPACLLLMSVVKDAERLGDYCKNLFEVIGLLEKPMDNTMYTGLFNGMDREILDLFEKTKKIFGESDEAGAKMVWQQEREIMKNCEDIIKKLTVSNLRPNELVSLTLIARYFKRLTAHLANIATSVIVPISDLDYFDERE